MDPSKKPIVSGVRLEGVDIEVPYGTPVGSLFRTSWFARDTPPLAAIVHNRCVDTSFPLCAPGDVYPVDYTTREGVLAYRRTASLILLEAARQVFPGSRVTIGQALGNGYFYRVFHGRDFSSVDMELLWQRMKEIVHDNLTITIETLGLEEARKFFASAGHEDKVCLLDTWWEPFVPVVRCGEVRDIHHYPVAPSTGYVTTFELTYYPPGMILRFPPRGQPQPVRPYHDSPKLFQVYTETRKWNELLGVTNVGQLNQIIIHGEANDLIRIAEGLHEKKIAQIADQIQSAQNRIKLVLIAGPSASGKTTFSKRLSLQLMVNGIRPVALSTDNFYVDRACTPLDDDGKYDFECIEAIDLPLFNDVLARLLKGERVLTPRFDFTTGTRRTMDKWVPMQLEPGQVLVVEGIHGLNERLTQAIPNDHKFRVYVSALTQLAIDDHNRIFTSDSRFLRRIVRDRLFRGYSAASTIEAWPRVRRGEMRDIFPYQDEADVMFNSALVYEQALLRLYAERFLLEVPQSHPSFVDAYRLLKFVQHFVPLFDAPVPQISILREFVGGSGFKY